MRTRRCIMGSISPTPSRRALLGAFAATSAAIVAAPATAETLRREFEAWDDEPIVLRRTKQGRSDSKFRYHNAEHFFSALSEDSPTVGVTCSTKPESCSSSQSARICLMSDLLTIGVAVISDFAIGRASCRERVCQNG